MIKVCRQVEFEKTKGKKMKDLYQCPDCLFIGVLEDEFNYNVEFESDGSIIINHNCAACDSDYQPEKFEGYQADEFIQGMKDAKQGKVHETKTTSYDAGYASQYALEQILSKGFN